MSIIATIEDGGGSRSLRFGDKSAETFAQRLVDDYRYRARLNAAIRRQQAIRRPQLALGPPIDRRDLGVEPSQSVPQMVTKAPAAAPSVLPQARTQRIAAPNETQLPDRRNQNMDLGSILGGIKSVAETYYDVKYGMDPRRPQPRPWMDGGWPTTQSVRQQDLGFVDYERLPGPGGRFPGRFTPGGIVGGVVGGALGDLAEQGLNLLSGRENFGGSMDNCAKPSDYVGQWDESSGTYVLKKKRKRRRKQLITQSDIKGLAALKGVVGTGKIMETWIATHC